MTAATLTYQPAASIRSDARLTFARILRSEWIKLTSLRSTYWSLALIAVLGIGFSLLLVSFTSGFVDNAEPDPNGVLTTTTVGVGFGQLIAAVLGVLVISGEYSTGMIRSTLAAVPSRLPVLVAKRRVGAAAYLGLTAVFALGLGTLLRSAAGGIAVALGIILVVDGVVPLLSLAVDWVSDITPYLFSSAGVAMARIPGEAAGTDPFAMTMLEPWAGTLVVIAWTLVSLTLGALRLTRKDA